MAQRAQRTCTAAARGRMRLPPGRRPEPWPTPSHLQGRREKKERGGTGCWALAAGSTHRGAESGQRLREVRRCCGVGAEGMVQAAHPCAAAGCTPGCGGATAGWSSPKSRWGAGGRKNEEWAVGIGGAQLLGRVVGANAGRRHVAGHAAAAGQQGGGGPGPSGMQRGAAAGPT
jgi:hypothetical protein